MTFGTNSGSAYVMPKTIDKVDAILPELSASLRDNDVTIS